MNPGIVTAAVVVVGAIATALCYVFSEQSNFNQSHGHGGRSNNFTYNHYHTNNYLSFNESAARPESRRRKGTKRTVRLNDDCAICLEPLSGDVEILPCEHVFHHNCIAKMVQLQPGSSQEKAKCPLCRNPID